MQKITRLAIVVPCYNEEAVLEETSRRLLSLLDVLINREQTITENSFILYVNDGSRDNTWSIISQKQKENTRIWGCDLAKNVGHQNALWAGLEVANRYADAIVSIDADLQDDENTIIEMIEKYHSGFDIVYGVRQSRETDSTFKRNTALAFYKLMQAFDCKTVYNHADFRLMSQRATTFLLSYPERNLFIRGLVPTVGYNTTEVYYDRRERFAGESKYPFSKMLNFAIDGITSFSVKPVRLVFVAGLLFILVAFGVLIWIVSAWSTGNVVPGWSSLMVSVWFVAGANLMGIGIVGEYVGKIYLETKHRPRYNIKEILSSDR